MRDGRANLVAERGRLAALRDRHDSAAARLDRDARTAADRAIAMGEEARDLVDRMSAIGDERQTLAALERLPARRRSIPGPSERWPPIACRSRGGW